MRIAGLILAASLAACATQPPASASGDGLPAGGMRITRVTDPTVACMVVRASELAGGRFGAPVTATRDGGATVSWRNVATDSGTKKLVRCEVDTRKGLITSITADGVELLDRPQPL